MFLVVEHGCAKWLLTIHSDMGYRDDYCVFRFLRTDMAQDASFIASVGDFRDNLLRLNNDGGLLRAQKLNELWRQFDFEWNRCNCSGFLTEACDFCTRGAGSLC